MEERFEALRQISNLKRNKSKIHRLFFFMEQNLKMTKYAILKGKAVLCSVKSQKKKKS